MGYNVGRLSPEAMTDMPQKRTLRDVQKADTRRRLLDAAKVVFVSEGYTQATVEKITREAGASRPTFYLHFKDKEEVLHELVAEYGSRTAEFMQCFPGPRPERSELVKWLEEVGGFLQQEDALAEILLQVIGLQSAGGHSYGLQALGVWVNAMAQKSPAFAAALDRENEDTYAQAQASLLAIQIVWAASNSRRNPSSALTRHTVELTATALCEFMNDPRFHKQ